MEVLSLPLSNVFHSNPNFAIFRNKSHHFLFPYSHIRHKSFFLPPNSFNFRKCTVKSFASQHHNNHDHDHHHHSNSQGHDHGHDHHHHHHHCHNCGGETKLSKSQERVLRVAKAIGWVDLANYLRENMQLCICSMGLFLAAAVSPYLVPKPVIKPLQNAFICLAFPLVGVMNSSFTGFLYCICFFFL